MLHDRPSPSPRTRAAFTIIELVVVMGVIGILALLTTIGARRLTSGSRLAAATNAVTSALGNARAAAIKDSEVTGVVFRPVWNPLRPNIPQRVEIITVRSTGERAAFGATSIGLRMAERFRPVQGIPATVLPEGVKVAGPMYDPPGNFGSIPAELVYSTQIELPLAAACGESIEFNRVIAVLFGPNGEFLTALRAPRSTSRSATSTGTTTAASPIRRPIRRMCSWAPARRACSSSSGCRITRTTRTT